VDVLKTLHTYLARELAKVTLLALVAFTLVMTVFAIIEPLRKQGLATDQVAELFAYTLPVMLSLTFPISALFAATIVYGRFSQDNELLACRASGISTFVMLTPAIALAAIVTVCSVALANFVAPAMAARAGVAVKANLRGIAYNELRTHNYIEDHGRGGNRTIIYADDLEADADLLYGVVAIHKNRRTGRTTVVTARQAKAHFVTTPEGDNYVAVDLLQMTGTGVTGLEGGRVGRQPVPPIKIPNPTREKPSWYNWDELLRTIRNPALNAAVARELAQIRRDTVHDAFCREVADALNDPAPAGRTYAFTDAATTCLLQAGRAVATQEGTVRLAATDDRPVTVIHVAEDAEQAGWKSYGAAAMPAGPQALAYAGEMLAGAALPTVVTARSGVVETEWDPRLGRSVVTVKLEEAVRERRLAREGEASRLSSWERTFAVPERISRTVRRLDLGRIYTREPTGNALIEADIERLKTELVPGLMGGLIAEMHGRIAYGVSSLLLIALGAGLGLIFRGGQIISAFAIAVIPTLFTIVLMLMGKEMARHPQVPMVAGLSLMWVGVAGLFVATVTVYTHLARR
jgi:lipopolysaccharide export LptBFGC system permease protein LptF